MKHCGKARVLAQYMSGKPTIQDFGRDSESCPSVDHSLALESPFGPKFRQTVDQHCGVAHRKIPEQAGPED